MGDDERSKRTSTQHTEIAKVGEQAYKEGMKPLRAPGALKMTAGLTTFDEVLRVAPPSGADA